MRWISFIFVMGLLGASLAFPSYVQLNGFTTILATLLSIPFIAPYISSLNILGSQFDFKDTIEKVESLTSKAVENSNKKKDKSSLPSIKVDESWPSAFLLENAFNLVETDTALALASVRIEIERALTVLYQVCAREEKLQFQEKKSLFHIIQVLHQKSWLRSEQVEALKNILVVCNQAIHGRNISYAETLKIIQLTEELGRSFSMGYIPSFIENKDFEEQGRYCQWQHCIELSPFSGNKVLACHMFGHDCPGGVSCSIECRKKHKVSSKNK